MVCLRVYDDVVGIEGYVSLMAAANCYYMLFSRRSAASRSIIFTTGLKPNRTPVGVPGPIRPLRPRARWFSTCRSNVASAKTARKSINTYRSVPLGSFFPFLVVKSIRGTARVYFTLIINIHFHPAHHEYGSYRTVSVRTKFVFGKISRASSQLIARVKLNRASVR